MTVTPTLRDHRAMATTEARWRTSTPAVFALALGLCSLLFALLPALAAVAVVLSLAALTCGAVGMTQGRRPGFTGRGVAIVGVLLAVAGLILSSPTMAGFDWFGDGSPLVLRTGAGPFGG